MTSLAEAYDRRASEVSHRRLYLGTGLFLAGALLVVLGILAGATATPVWLGFTLAESREIAGVLAGLGVPAVFVGVFTVLPASQTQRALAAVGAGVAVLGVTLFRYVYPGQWYAANGTPTLLTLAVVTIYFAGTIATFWCLFAAGATFKRRNDPGGTVSLTFTRGGETKTVRVAAEDADRARAALGGVGVFGGVDDPDSEAGTAGGRTQAAAAPSSDGGTASSDLTSPLDDADGGQVLDHATEPAEVADQYCGNCADFQYVRTNGGIRPYCNRHGERMDDMDACEEWRPNRSPGRE